MGVLVLVGLVLAAIAASPIAGTISEAIECEVRSVAGDGDACEASDEEPASGQAQSDRGSDSVADGSAAGGGGAPRLDSGDAQRARATVPASLSSGRAPVMTNASIDARPQDRGSACAAFTQVPFGDAGSASPRRRAQAGPCEEQLEQALDRLPGDQRRLAQDAEARALEDRGCGAGQGGQCSVEQVLHVRYHILADLRNTPEAERAQRARALAQARQQVGALAPPPVGDCDTSGVDGFLLGDACLALKNLGEGDIVGGAFHGILAWPGGRPLKGITEGAEQIVREGTEEAAEEGTERAARESAEQAARQGPSSPPRWVRGTEGNAGKVPESVAGRLRGRMFASRQEFRENFWKEVADDPALAAQFGPANVALMRDGLAPFAARTQRYGGHERYVLHHRTPVARGGDVYDPDNIIVVTPRYHQEALDGSYHFGRGG
jgi:hypothetical protein